MIRWPGNYKSPDLFVGSFWSWRLKLTKNFKLKFNFTSTCSEQLLRWFAIVSQVQVQGELKFQLFTVFLFVRLNPTDCSCLQQVHCFYIIINLTCYITRQYFCYHHRHQWQYSNSVTLTCNSEKCRRFLRWYCSWWWRFSVVLISKITLKIRNRNNSYVYLHGIGGGICMSSGSHCPHVKTIWFDPLQ